MVSVGDQLGERAQLHGRPRGRRGLAEVEQRPRVQFVGLGLAPRPTAGQVDQGSRFTLEFPATSPNASGGESIPHIHKSTSIQEVSADGSAVSGAL